MLNELLASIKAEIEEVIRNTKFISVAELLEKSKFKEITITFT